MHRFLERTRFQIRWRLYARIALVFAVALLLIGGVGFWGAKRSARETRFATQAHDLVEFATSVRSQVLLVAVGLESTRLEPSPLVPSGAVLAVVPDGDPSAIILAEGSDHLDNRNTLAMWLTAHLSGDGQTVGWPEPVLVDVPDAFLQVEIHAPLRLEAGGEVQENLALPVIVRRTGFPRPTLVGLLDVAQLLPGDLVHHAWWGLTVPNGEMLLTSTVTEAPPADLIADLTAASSEKALTTDSQGRWTLSHYQGGDLPFGVVMSAPPQPLPGATRVVHLVAALALLLALGGATLVADGVMAGLTRRLTSLGVAMETLARGEDSQRLPARGQDEVSRLEGYFNLMAASLEEAHRDVTDKADELEASLEDLRAHDRAKDDFLALVSHEVRTPLTCILGGLERLQATLREAQGADRDTLERLGLHDIVEIVDGNSKRLNGFLGDALQITAIQSGHRDLELKAVAPAELLEPCLQSIAAAAESRGIAVVDEMSETAGWHVLGDLKILRVALGKLLDNAVRHNTDGGRVHLREVAAVPELGEPQELLLPENVRRFAQEPAFAHWADEEMQWRIIEIYNTGPAIPADRMPTLFGKFELVEPIEHHSRGTGLSLPIAQAVLEQHGGRVFALSRETVGTSFFLLLPTLGAGAVDQSVGNLWDDLPEGVRGGTTYEEIRQVTDTALGEVELDDRHTLAPGESDQSGGGVDGAGSPDHEEEPATCDSIL